MLGEWVRQHYEVDFRNKKSAVSKQIHEINDKFQKTQIKLVFTKWGKIWEARRNGTVVAQWMHEDIFILTESRKN